MTYSFGLAHILYWRRSADQNNMYIEIGYCYNVPGPRDENVYISTYPYSGYAIRD
jgi:hypothetical protein